MSETRSEIESVSEAVTRLVGDLNHLTSDAGEQVLRELLSDFKHVETHWRQVLNAEKHRQNLDQLRLELAEREKTMARNAAAAVARGQGENFELQATKSAILGRIGEVILEAISAIS